MNLDDVKYNTAVDDIVKIMKQMPELDRGCVLVNAAHKFDLACVIFRDVESLGVHIHELEDWMNEKGVEFIDCSGSDS